MDWKTIYIFISSTFRDMFFEREYLVKRVFPELKTWCAERNLELADIDLRWGITEEMAQKERAVVMKCLQGVDDARPFFLCFLGQYRGWVPTEGEISPETFEAYGSMKRMVGKNSVTEMEIAHALGQKGPGGALFFYRDPSYLAQMPQTDEYLDVYTNHAIKDPGERQLADMTLKALVERQLPSVGYTPCRYTVQFREGALTGFKAHGKPLAQVVLEELKRNILERYPDRALAAPEPPLQKELSAQRRRLHAAAAAFIDHGDAVLLEGQWQRTQGPLILFGRTGEGKSALLSHFIETMHPEVLFRFGRDYPTLSGLLKSVLLELGADGAELGRRTFPELLAQVAAAMDGRALAIDGLERYPVLEATQLLAAAKGQLLVTVRRDSDMGMQLSTWAEDHHVPMFTVQPFYERYHRQRLVEQYLRRYMKSLDEQQMNVILSKPGTANPLFLKIILSEIRVFGSYEKLPSLLERFGQAVQSAFTAVLQRLEEDFSLYGDLVQRAFAALAASKNGLSVEEWATATGGDDVRDELHVILRQLEPFMEYHNEGGQRIADFGYSSFRQAAWLRYKAAIPDAQQRLLEVFSRRAGLRDGSYAGGRRALELAYYHARQAESVEAPALLADFRYLDARIRMGGLYALLDDLEDTRDSALSGFLYAHAGGLFAQPDSLLSLLLLEAEGQLHRRAQEAARDWPHPYIAAQRVPLPSCGQPQEGASGVEIIYEKAFDSAYAFDVAVDTDMIFRWEKPGTLSVYDGRSAELPPAVVEIRRARVLGVFASSGGDYVAIACEDGTLQVLSLSFDGRTLGWSDTAYTGNYLLPEVYDPAMCWEGHALYFQAESGGLAKLDFDEGAQPETVFPVEGEVCAILPMEGGPAVAARTGEGSVWRSGGASRAFPYEASHACAWRGGIACAFADGSVTLLDAAALEPVQAVASDLHVDALAARGETLYLLANSTLPGGERLYACGADGTLAPVKNTEALFPQKLAFRVGRMFFDEAGLCHSLTAGSYRAADLEGSPSGGVTGVRCAYVHENKLHAVLEQDGFSYLAADGEIVSSLEKGTLVPYWRNLRGMAVGNIPVETHPLHCMDGQQAYTLPVPETMRSIGGGGERVWLLGESGRAYTLDGAGLRESGVGLPGLSGMSIDTAGDMLICSGLDTEAESIGQRLVLYRLTDGQPQKAADMLFPGQAGHYQCGVYDSGTGRYYAFLSLDGISLCVGRVTESGLGARQITALPYLASARQAALFGGCLYVLGAGGDITVMRTDGARVCAVASLIRFEALHPTENGVYASARDRLYKLDVVYGG